MRVALCRMMRAAPRHLFYRLPLDPEGGHESGDLGGCRLAFHHLRHDGHHLGLAQVFPSTVLAIASLIMRFPLFPVDQFDKIPDDPFSVRGQDRLGMELDPLDRPSSVPEPHDLPFRRLCADLQAAGRVSRSTMSEW